MVWIMYRPERGKSEAEGNRQKAEGRKAGTVASSSLETCNCVGR